MKFLQVYTFYPVYLEHWLGGNRVVPGSGADSAQQQLRADRFFASHDWARDLEKKGWETRWWVANFHPAVNAYRAAHGQSPARNSDDEDGALRDLIEEFQPDVLFVGNPVRFDGRFIATLRFRPRLIVGWMAAAFPPSIDWSGYDLFLSHLSVCRAAALRQGARRVDRFHPGFPLDLWERFGSAAPECDVLFSGQWTSDHGRRNRMLHELAKEADRADAPIDLRFQLAPHAHALPSEVARRDHGARWGADMFRAMRSGRIALNAEIDIASGEAGNMRLFEATGMGALLLTEHQPNIEAFFEPGREIETFRSTGEMVEKIRWYLGHPTQLESIASAGRKACHERFSSVDRANLLEAILLEHLSAGRMRPEAEARAGGFAVGTGRVRRESAGSVLLVLGPAALKSDLETGDSTIVVGCESMGDGGGRLDYVIVESKGATSEGDVVAQGANVVCAALDLAWRLRPGEVVLKGFEAPRLGFANSGEDALRQLHDLRRKLDAAEITVLDESVRDDAGPFLRIGRKPSHAGRERTVHGTILKQLEMAGSKPVVHILGAEGWQDWSGEALRDRILRWMEFFRKECQPGELVLFSRRLDVDLLAGYLGAMAAGCVPAQTSPESPRVPAAERLRKLRHVLSITRARMVFSDFITPEDSAGVDRMVTSADIPPSFSGDPNPRQSGNCLAQFSSGTTGLQKAVLLSHAGVIAHMDAFAPAIGLDASDTVVSWLPLYHDMGLMAGFLMPLFQGVPLAIMDPFTWIAKPDLLGEAAELYSGTVTFLPNFAYHVLARGRRHPGLNRIRLFVNCSEPARAESHKLFRDAYPRIGEDKLSVCWAMAENCFAVSQTRPGVPPRILDLGGRRLLSCGTVLPGTEVRVLDPDREGVGELAIRGACLFARFLDGVDRMIDGYYPTGDLGVIVDGEIFVAGRKKDLLIVHGKNIYPQDVDNAVGACAVVHPGRAVCFGVESPETGSEELVVLYEPAGDDASGDAHRVVSKAVEDEIGILPRRIQAVPARSLVKTTSGKMSRARIKELYLQGAWGEQSC